MKNRCLALLAALGAFGVLGTLGAATALAAPTWNLDLHHAETNFAPGGEAQYWVDVDNVGDTDSSGTVTVTVSLPSGVSRNSVLNNFDPNVSVAWSCPGSPGATKIVCTTSTPIPRHTLARQILVKVDVAPSASGVGFATAKVEGGGAAAATTVEPTAFNPQPAPFGILADSFTPDFVEADGLTPRRESGGHPELLTVPFDLATITQDASVPAQKAAAGNLHEISVDLPPGFIGNPSAVGECSQAQFLVSACPPSSQVGRIDVHLFPVSNCCHWPTTTPVFNLAHPRGTVTDLAFVVSGLPVHIKAYLDPTRNYAISTTVPNINEVAPVFDQKLTIWGVPADPSHDSERCRGFKTADTSVKCSTDITPRPFLTLPSSCGVEHSMRIHRYDSWQNRGAFGPNLVKPLAGQTTECGKPRFEPRVQVHPTGNQANTPTGLEVRVKVPQNESPSALSTPPVKSVKVSLPKGMTVSPSFADGLTGCSEAQIGLGTDAAVACPDSSRIGAVSLSTPLLPRSLEGSLYLARQKENPFGSTFALYLAIHDVEERGVLVKIPGKLELDPVTGQITTSFDELPQFPFDDFTLAFRSGQRAPLVNPPTCGSQRIDVQVASYAQPGNLLDVSSRYEVTEGPGGTPCLATRPFSPKMVAGTVNPAAASYSPFVFRLTREDAEQELSSIATQLAPGIAAKLAGIPYCPEAAIASVPTAEGTGQSQLANSSCPPASLIGTVNTGVGAGTGPNYFQGRVYLAGPYKGAPLSIAIVVPALAGPYDLGNVVVRAAIHVDPSTAEVRVVSDPLPTILHGVLLRVRDIRLMADRPDTILNPTSCDPMAIKAQAIGVGGDVFTPSDDSLASMRSPFQVANCAALGFKPKLTFSLGGGTHRGDFPALKATLRARPGDANIARAAVTLPHTLFLAQQHIRTICTRVQFAANACPPASIYGKARAVTPLLDEPLEGPVYLRSSSNPLPDLVARLNGRFEVVLAGRIDSVNEGIRNTFDVIPDAPVSTFTLQMQGGRKSLLVNSRNLCKTQSRAQVRLTGQNAKTSMTRPVMKTSCKRSLKSKRTSAGHARSRR